MTRKILLWLACALLPFPLVSGGLSTAFAAAPADPAREAILPYYLQYSGRASGELLGVPWDGAQSEKELARLAGRIRPAIADATSGAQVVEAFRRVLLEEEGFSYDAVAGNPENFLLGSVLARKRGNCLGLSMLYLALAERLPVPFRGACLPSHCFVRYEGADGTLNVEFALGGAVVRDERYRKEFRIGPDRPYLRSLHGAEMLGVFLKSLGAAYSKAGREEEALRLYDEAVRFLPGLPDTHFNAGVSLQRAGKLAEATGKYRDALSMDPGHAPSRENLSIVLAMQGLYAEAIAEGRRAVELEPRNAVMRRNLAHTYYSSGNIEEGILEYRRAVEIDPKNARGRAGLVISYYAAGRYESAIEEYGAAKDLGFRFEPSLLEELEEYRAQASPER